MADADATAAAIAALNESDMNGRTIYVSESLPKDQVEKKKPARRTSRREFAIDLSY
jgi:RNA recognition motif-containing protein